MNIETIVFENNTLKIINQQLLPQKFEYIQLDSLTEVIDAIQSLKVRGAPAIGVTAAYGFYLKAVELAREGKSGLQAMQPFAEQLIRARPTAVNLRWAVNEMMHVLKSAESGEQNNPLSAIRDKAVEIHQQDRHTCSQIGSRGADLIDDGDSVLTHCNAGALATGGMGTALSVVYKAWQQDKRLHVFVDETRPVGQGARLTYWELAQNGIPATLITDNMAGALMQDKRINKIIVGADRIAGNGDVANKIGTYGLAVLAGYHKIPFYVAAPFSTFDLSIGSGAEIPIEQRPDAEILDVWNINGSLQYNVHNPAFDITPHALITALITENGLIYNPNTETLNYFFNNHQ